MTVPQLTALLNTIPMEITFVDADNINRFFNEGEKVFKRPGMAIDREVFSCHPPKIEPMVRGIINDFRNNRRDCVPVWMEKGGRTMLVQYMAVRDRNGEYLGTVELVQDMEFVQFHPTALKDKFSENMFLISEAVRGEGAKLVNTSGEYFAKKYHPILSTAK